MKTGGIPDPSGIPQRSKWTTRTGRVRLSHLCTASDKVSPKPDPKDHSDEKEFNQSDTSPLRHGESLCDAIRSPKPNAPQLHCHTFPWRVDRKLCPSSILITISYGIVLARFCQPLKKGCRYFPLRLEFSHKMKAETILRGGVFPTIPEASAVAIGGERLLAIGHAAQIAPLATEITRVIDLNGKAVLPGFIDAHTHFLQIGLSEIGLRIDLVGLSRTKTLARLAAAVRERGKGEWVVGCGWDESTWQAHDYLRREELDRITGKTPLVAVRIDGHLLTANSCALAHIPLNVNRGLVDLVSGILREEAAFAFLRTVKPDEGTLREALYRAATVAHRHGITSIHTMLAPERIRLYMHERGRLKLRVTLCPEVSCLDALETLGIESGFGDAWLRLGGIKLFADGSIGARNAALGEPYADSSEQGALNYSDEELISFIRRCDQAGLQTVIHAIGDRAIEQVLGAHSVAGSSRDLRHRIEHFELPTAAHIARAKDLGLHISMQPNFVGNWSGEGKMYTDRLGRTRDQQIDPHRLVLDAGLPLAFGSDCMPMSPLFGLHWAVNAPHPNQRVSVEEAITCYTKMGAYFSFEERQKGVLAGGMLADLVILNRDPRKIPDRLANLEVEMTFLGGELVYQRS